MIFYERHLKSGTDLVGKERLAAQCCIMCDDGCVKMGLVILVENNKLDFEGFVAVVELESLAVRGNLLVS